ncbi:MAG: RimK/LysX family protein [Pseudomonadota bacterium]
MLRHLGYLVSLLILSACATTENVENPIEPRLAEINTNIERLEKTLSKQIAKGCRQSDEKIMSQLTEAIAASKLIADEETVEHEGCVVSDDNDKAQDKLMLGEVESILFIDAKKRIDARIDTGAETSSLGVYNIKRFERDGKKWIRFTLTDKENARVHRYPIYDSVRIKRESDEKAERRREIKLDIKIGGVKYRKQVFNLADRSHLEFQVLIGRSFLRDIAVVDVSSRYLLGGK